MDLGPLVQGIQHWQILVNTLMYIRVRIHTDNFLAS
jgi:hypothetical protein